MNNNNTIHQEELQRATLKQVAAVYLNKHDPSDVAHTITETTHPKVATLSTQVVGVTATTTSTTSTSATTAAIDNQSTTNSHTNEVSKTTSPVVPSIMSSLFPRVSATGTSTALSSSPNIENHTADTASVDEIPDRHVRRNLNPDTTNQPTDLTTHVQELIVHARMDVERAQHQLHTLLQLEATLRNDGNATNPQPPPPPMQTHPLNTPDHDPPLPSPPPINNHNETTEKDES